MKLFIIHSPQWPTFKITKAVIFHHNMRHLLKNENIHIVVNELSSPIPQGEENNKQDTARDVNRDNCVRWLQHINGQQIRRILHEIDNNILKNLPIFREDVGWAEDIYGPSVPHFQGKRSGTRCTMGNLLHYKVPQRMSLTNKIHPPYAVTSCTSTVLDSLKPYWHIMFDTVIMIKY